MTNLSKELCEICGIEPKIIEDYDSNEYELNIPPLILDELLRQKIK